MKRVAATVRDHDPASGAGGVLLDDGTSVSYDRSALEAGSALLLRSGQRVLVECDESGRVVRIELPGFPLG